MRHVLYLIVKWSSRFTLAFMLGSVVLAVLETGQAVYSYVTEPHLTRAEPLAAEYRLR